MSRTGKISKRPVKSDPIYHSRLVTRMINRLMQSGKKALSRRVVYSVLEELDADSKKAREFFERALGNVTPEQEVRSRRVGGATYQIPIPVRRDRAEALAIRWIIAAAKERKGMSIKNGLLAEIKAAYKNEGGAAQKKETIRRMADSNRAFAHFRW